MSNPIQKALIVSTLGMTAFAHASGTFLQEATYANLGTAGAGDGVYTDTATSIWTNPAIMSHMKTEQTTVTGTLLNLDISYTDTGSKPGASSNSTLPTAGFFHVIDLENDFKVGLAFGSPGGASLDYGQEWAGNRQLTDVALLTYQFNPSVSYSVNDKWSIAAGAQIDYAVLEGNTSALNLGKASDWAFGFNLGTVYQATDKLRLGASYRSEINHKFEADLGTPLNQGSYRTSLPSAAITDLSAAYQVSERLTLMSSIQHHNWSTMTSTDIDIHLPNYNDIYSIQRDWQDVWRISVGSEYALSSTWSLKVGYAYETSPLDDPSKLSPDLPVGEQHRYSIGFGKKLDDGRIDFYYQYADFGDMDIAQTPQGSPIGLNGTFTGNVHFIGASYTY